MTEYWATIVDVQGDRAAELTFKNFPSDPRPRRIYLIEKYPDPQFGPLPFTWRFIEETWERRYPIIDLVAAPGVTIQLEGFPNPPYPGPGVPLINIYRVQDPAVLPALATDPNEWYLLGSDGPSDFFDITRECPYSVDRFPSGVSINMLDSGHQWLIEVPQFCGDRSSARDALARFAYEIETEGLEHPHLKIVKTPPVTLRVKTYLPPGGPDWPFLGGYTVELWEAYFLRDVPPQGSAIISKAGWRPITSVDRIPTPSEELQRWLLQSAFDTSVGAIPVVGDCVDVAEFAYGLVTGTDRWGNRLSAGDLALMGLGAVIPFIASPALRRGKQLLRRFGAHADDAIDLTQRVRQAWLTKPEMEFIQSIDATIRAGRRVPPELWARSIEILNRIPKGSQPTVEMLLNMTEDGFAHAQLQEAYRAYVTKQTRTGKRAAKPAEWAREVTSGRPRQLLELLLGPHYARTVGVGANGARLNLIDVARPKGFTDAQLHAWLATHTKYALAYKPKLYERLGNLAIEPIDVGVQELGLIRRTINRGQFRIFKGNLAEVLSIPKQVELLKRITKKNPGARLVSGVRVRLMKGGKLAPSKLFSDNIIIERVKGGINVLAVFEVKAGFKGGQEATEQIFDWIEGRLTDGSQLLIPKGATLVDEAGHARTVVRDTVFTWHPHDRRAPTVTNLAGAERHFITARGTSNIGIDSAMGVAPRVTRHQLNQTSEELDYLAAKLLSAPEVTPTTLPSPPPLLMRPPEMAD